MYHAPVIIIEEYEWAKERPIARAVAERMMGIWSRKGITVIITSDAVVTTWKVFKGQKKAVWIDLPDADMRRNIVRKKADEMGMELTSEERKTIAGKAKNGYQIEGMLKRLYAARWFE